MWYERGLVAVVAVVVSFGSWGVLLAVIGHLRLAFVVPTGAVTAAVLVLLAWPRWVADKAARFGRPAAVMVVIAVAIFVWNAVHSGQYVSIDRDPGVYAATAKWLEHNGSLEVSAGDVWLSKGSEFNWASSGMYPEGLRANFLEFQFSHLAPTLFALAGSVFGDRALFATPALLGSLGLCAVYATGCRLVDRPWIVLAAVTALGLSLPQISVSRDTYSETSAQLMLWSGLWLLMVAFERRRIGVAVLAGLAIGGTLLARADALVYFLLLPVAAVLAILTATAAARRFLIRMSVVVLLTAGALATLGLIDLQVRSTGYFTALNRQFSLLVLAGVAGLVAAFVFAAIWTRRPKLGEIYGRWRSRLATAVAACGVLGFVVVWAVRPAFLNSHIPLANGTTATAQAAEGLPVDGTLSYAGQSMTWITWYLGGVTVVFAIVGFGVLLHRLVMATQPAAILLLAVAGAGCALYVLTPQITPTQIWAMRRYVPAALPFLYLAAAVAVTALAALLPRIGLSTVWGRLVPITAVIGIVGFPLGVTVPVANYRTQLGYLNVVDKLCTTIGPDAAVMIATKDRLDLTMTQTVRSYCQVPAAWLVKPVTSARADALAVQWKSQGRRLWVIGSSAAAVSKSVPGVTPALVGAVSNDRHLEETVSRPPEAYTEQTLTIWAAPVD